MNVLQIQIEQHGPIATHNYPCPIYWGDQKAVYRLNDGVFLPSWYAQRLGWQTVHAKTPFQRWVLKLLFGCDFNA